MDARAFPVAAGDPFALPAQEQGGTNKWGVMMRTFHFYYCHGRSFAKKMLLQEEPRTQEETKTHQ